MEKIYSLAMFIAIRVYANVCYPEYCKITLFDGRLREIEGLS